MAAAAGALADPAEPYVAPINNGENGSNKPSASFLLPPLPLPDIFLYAFFSLSAAHFLFSYFRRYD
jgi:hypothetical protein